MTKQQGHPFCLFFVLFNSVHIPHSLENITDAKISLRKVPFKLLLAGAAVKNPTHSSNRSDLFYGTGYTVILRKFSQDNLQMFLFQPTPFSINLVYTVCFNILVSTVLWQFLIHLGWLKHKASNSKLSIPNSLVIQSNAFIQLSNQAIISSVNRQICHKQCGKLSKEAVKCFTVIWSMSWWFTDRQWGQHYNIHNNGLKRSWTIPLLTDTWSNRGIIYLTKRVLCSGIYCNCQLAKVKITGAAWQNVDLS